MSAFSPACVSELSIYQESHYGDAGDGWGLPVFGWEFGEVKRIIKCVGGGWWCLGNVCGEGGVSRKLKGLD